MCGICGIIRSNREVLTEEIESMKNVLVHRGPDDEGSFFPTVKLPGGTVNVGLGHRRADAIMQENSGQF